MLKVAIICGGPSKERGISLNSARSLMDHLASDNTKVYPIYVDAEKNFYSISQAQLYSNTPADFDFKLSETASLFNEAGLLAYLKKLDIVFPCIHGPYGEDGELQAWLEKHRIPFVGLSSDSCRKAFCKGKARDFLKENKFATLPYLNLKNNDFNLSQIQNFFKEYHLKKVVVKPTCAGSSLGVQIAKTPQDAKAKCEQICAQFESEDIIIEAYCSGKEFTVVVLENQEGQPVALIPTEVQMDYANDQIFDYRRKYLPTGDAFYHTPPRFTETSIKTIRRQAEELFKLFNMHDFIRMDGWISDGVVYFTDFNPISGLEQNSFLFRQSSLIGLTHRQALDYILTNACKRLKLEHASKQMTTPFALKKSVYILFGGNTAERQVSLMSGTNVWLKLHKSDKYAPSLFMMFNDHIWEIPYSYALSHTVEEIAYYCQKQPEQQVIDQIEEIQKLLKIRNHHPLARQLNLEAFIQEAIKANAFIFLGLHGGIGEDGTLQQIFDKHGLKYNGSSAEGSRICMDKFLTGQYIEKLQDAGLLSLKKNLLSFQRQKDLSSFWEDLCLSHPEGRFVIKPRKDGCSAGIVILTSLEDLYRYQNFYIQKAKAIPPSSFFNQPEIVELPSGSEIEFILEPFIETDSLLIKNHRLIHKLKKGWLELTVGLLESNDHYHALNPSITVAEAGVLTLEEKFQGGTGVNITPPPSSLISLPALNKLKKQIEKAGKALKIKNYARVDIFFNITTEQIIIIEANSLPALTPSTVFFHQGLAEDPPRYPLELLEDLISQKLQSRSLETVHV